MQLEEIVSSCFNRVLLLVVSFDHFYEHQLKLIFSQIMMLLVLFASSIILSTIPWKTVVLTHIPCSTIRTSSIRSVYLVSTVTIMQKSAPQFFTISPHPKNTTLIWVVMSHNKVHRKIYCHCIGPFLLPHQHPNKLPMGFLLPANSFQHVNHGHN